MSEAGEGPKAAMSEAGEKDVHLTETMVESHEVFDGALLHVRRDTVRLPDGSLASREFIVHPGAALVVPVLPDGNLIAVRQFRYPVGAVFLEFPAGKIDPPESALATARRELTERGNRRVRHRQIRVGSRGPLERGRRLVAGPHADGHDGFEAA